MRIVDAQSSLPACDVVGLAKITYFIDVRCQICVVLCSRLGLCVIDHRLDRLLPLQLTIVACLAYPGSTVLIIVLLPEGDGRGVDFLLELLGIGAGDVDVRLGVLVIVGFCVRSDVRSRSEIGSAQPGRLGCDVGCG